MQRKKTLESDRNNLIFQINQKKIINKKEGQAQNRRQKHIKKRNRENNY